MRQLLIDRRTAGYAGGQRQVDYVDTTTNQRLDLQWVSPGTLRTELGITAAQWRTWGHPRDGGCFVLSAPGGNFVPGLLRWDEQQGYVVWRGAGERLDRVVVAAAAPLAPAPAPALPAAAAPVPVPAAALAGPANDGDDDDDGGERRGRRGGGLRLGGVLGSS